MAKVDESGELKTIPRESNMSPRDRADAARKAADAAATAAAAAESAAAAAERALEGLGGDVDETDPVDTDPAAASDADEESESVEVESSVVTEPVETKAGSLSKRRPGVRSRRPRIGAKRRSGADKPAESGSGTEAGTPRTRPVKRTVIAAAAVLLILVVAAAVVNVLLFQKDRDFSASQDTRVDYLQAAKQGVVNMTTIDFNNAQRDVQRVIDGSTGEFRKDFEGRSQSFIDVVTKSKVSTKGEIQNAGIEKIDGNDSGVVMIASTSKVTNSAGAQDETRAWRLRVTMIRAEGQLKMSKVEFVP